MEDILNLPGDGVLCVVAAVFNEKGEVLLGLRHYGNKYGTELAVTSVWTMPGGRSDEGETIGECLTREVKEEVGIDVEPVECLGEFPGARKGDVLHMFQCTYTGTPINNEPHKFEKWEWFAVEQFPENYINPHTWEALMRRKDAQNSV